MHILHHMTVLSWHLPWLSFTFSLHVPSTSLKWTGGVNIQDLGKMLLWQSITGEGRTFDYVRVPQHWSDCWPALHLPCWRWLVVGRVVSVIYEIFNGSKIQPNRCNEREARKSWFYQQGHPCANLLLDGVCLGYLTEFICMRAIHWVADRPQPFEDQYCQQLLYTYRWQACHSHSMVGSWKITYFRFVGACDSCFVSFMFLPRSQFLPSKVHYKHRSWSSRTNAEAQFPFGFAKDCTSSREKVRFVALFWRWVWHPLGDWSLVMLFERYPWIRIGSC